MAIPENVVLQLAALARRQAVVSARIEGKYVPAESRHSREDIFAIVRSVGIEIVDEHNNIIE